MAADEDPVENEEADVNVETSDVLKTDEEEESTADGYKNSPNADITVMFTKPVGNGLG